MKPNSVFDGFCHRPYNEDLDGWMETQPDERDYPCISQAKDVLALFHELKEANREIWQLRKELERYQK